MKGSGMTDCWIVVQMEISDMLKSPLEAISSMVMIQSLYHLLYLTRHHSRAEQVYRAKALKGIFDHDRFFKYQGSSVTYNSFASQ